MIKMMSFEEYLIMLDRERVTPSMMAKQMYEREIIVKQLREEIADLKEKVILLQASEPMLEFAKGTYKNNWNELKKWLEEELEILKSRNCSDRKNLIIVIETVLNKMQELEQGKDENTKN